MESLLTTQDTAEILNVSYQTIRRLISQPTEPLHYLRIGGSIRFEKIDILAYKYFKKRYTQVSK